MYNTYYRAPALQPGRVEGGCPGSLGAPTTTTVGAFLDTDKNCKRKVTFKRKKEVHTVLGTDWGVCAASSELLVLV